MVMEHGKLLEKHARAAGLGDIQVSWLKFAGGNVMNDALLSGTLHIAGGGVAPLITLWSKTVGGLDVKGAGALVALPSYLTTRNPKVKTIRDFTDNDRIALPAAKVSIQALMLQMAAEQVFGVGNHAKLDSLTVTMSNPDGMAAVLSGATGINSHFVVPPYSYEELKTPGVHLVLNSFDILGGPTTLTVAWTTGKFRNDNPKTYAAFVAALEEAVALINNDKRAAAEIYRQVSKSKETADEILRMLNDPSVQYSVTPKNVMKFLDFMHRVGSIKVRPASWKELFFPNVHQLPGS